MVENNALSPDEEEKEHEHGALQTKLPTLDLGTGALRDEHGNPIPGTAGLPGGVPIGDIAASKVSNVINETLAGKKRSGELILTGPMRPIAGFSGERSSGGEVLSKLFRDCGAGTESVVLWL